VSPAPQFSGLACMRGLHLMNWLRLRCFMPRNISLHDFFFVFLVGELFITHTCNERNHKCQMEGHSQPKLQATVTTWKGGKHKSLQKASMSSKTSLAHVSCTPTQSLACLFSLSKGQTMFRSTRQRHTKSCPNGTSSRVENIVHTRERDQKCIEAAGPKIGMHAMPTRHRNCHCCKSYYQSKSKHHTRWHTTRPISKQCSKTKINASLFCFFFVFLLGYRGIVHPPSADEGTERMPRFMTRPACLLCLRYLVEGGFELLSDFSSSEGKSDTVACRTHSPRGTI